MKTQLINSHQILNTCVVCNRKHIKEKCNCAYNKTSKQERIYRNTNRDLINKQRRDHRKQHGEEVRVKARIYREKNKDHINALKRNYYAEEKEKD